MSQIKESVANGQKLSRANLGGSCNGFSDESNQSTNPVSNGSHGHNVKQGSVKLILVAPSCPLIEAMRTSIQISSKKPPPLIVSQPEHRGTKDDAATDFDIPEPKVKVQFKFIAS